MATLLQILAKHLKTWPENNCITITQDGSGSVFFWKNDDLVFGRSQWLSNSGAALLDENWYFEKNVDLAEDHETAIITKAMWEAANQLRQ